MRGKPLMVSSIDERYNGIDYKLSFNDNHTFLSGDSGTGKSFMWNFLSDLKTIPKYSFIRTFNYKDVGLDLEQIIMCDKRKFFVIDNADILLSDSLRDYISFNYTNQYLIIGRDPRGLMLMNNNLASMRFDKEHKVLEMIPLVIKNGVVV